MGEQKKEFQSIKDIGILEIELSDYMIEMELFHPPKEEKKEETAEK